MNEDERKLMGKRIKECRNKVKLSQEGLAERLGMKRTNITNYEAGRVIPPGNILLDMSEIFGVTTDFILGKTEHPNSDTPTTIKTWLRQENPDLTDHEKEELGNAMEDYFQLRRMRILEERKLDKGE